MGPDWREGVAVRLLLTGRPVIQPWREPGQPRREGALADPHGRCLSYAIRGPIVQGLAWRRTKAGCEPLELLCALGRSTSPVQWASSNRAATDAAPTAVGRPPGPSPDPAISSLMGSWPLSNQSSCLPLSKSPWEPSPTSPRPRKAGGHALLEVLPPSFGATPTWHCREHQPSLGSDQFVKVTSMSQALALRPLQAGRRAPG